MRKLSLFVFLLFALSSWAADPTYDVAKRQLTIPNIVIGDTTYMGLVVRINSVDVVDAGGNFKSSGSGALPTQCPASIPKANYDKIAMGMSVDQVNKLIGCQFSRKSYSADFTYNPGQPDTLTLIWSMGEDRVRDISVIFDPLGRRVTPTSGDPADPNPNAFYKAVTFSEQTLTP